MQNENKNSQSQTSSIANPQAVNPSFPPGDSTQSMAEKALEAAEILRNENDRRLRIIEEERELQARRILGGQSEAGEAPKVETAAEYAKRILRGGK
jgi:hypothetical protein